MVKRKPKPTQKPESQTFYADSRVERIGDAICLTFHQLDNGDEVEVWLPLRSAGTAAMSLLEAAFGQRVAETVRRRADHDAYRKWLAEDATRTPMDWTKVGL